MKITDHRITPDDIILYKVGDQWLDYDDLITAAEPANQYEEDQAVGEVQREITSYFDGLEFEVVGYQRPIYF